MGKDTNKNQKKLKKPQQTYSQSNNPQDKSKIITNPIRPQSLTQQDIEPLFPIAVTPQSLLAEMAQTSPRIESHEDHVINQNEKINYKW